MTNKEENSESDKLEYKVKLKQANQPQQSKYKPIPIWRILFIRPIGYFAVT